MQTLTEIRSLLVQYGIRPRRRFGQNFLHDKNQLQKLVRASEAGEGDLVLEIGPGTGTLTEELLDRGAEVIAVEIDRDLVSLLRDRIGDRIHLLSGDCMGSGRTLALPVIEALGRRRFSLVANLPYGIACPLMAALLLDHPECIGQHVTIQREVADRLLASPGTRAWGPLGIIIQAMASVTRIGKIGPASFWPEPEVQSTMVSIHPRTSGMPGDPASFARFITALFSKRRKQLGTIYGRDHPWPDGVRSSMRPGVLSVEHLVEMHRLHGKQE